MSDTREEEPNEREFEARIECSNGDHAQGVFRDRHELLFDEPEYVDVGTDEYPCPHDYLLAAIGGCQVEVLKQCFEKSRIDEYEIALTVESEKSRVSPEDEIVETASVRITDIHTRIDVAVGEGYEERSRRCLEIFEENCPISRSVETGIDLTIRTE